MRILRGILAFVTLSAILVILVFLPTQGYLKAFLESVSRLGFPGALCLVLVYVPVCLLLLPGVLLTLGAGFLYGPFWGGAIASLGITLGALLPFLIGRFLAREWIERRIFTHPGFVAIDRAVARQGFKTVLLVRLCPFFPINPVNYMFGLTQIPLGRYVLATWLGRIPGLATTAYVGSAAKTLADAAAGNVEMGTSQQVLLGLGLALMVVMVVIFAQLANKLLRQAIGDHFANPQSPTPNP